ncbi:radical SAM additional 4Fe4S-binding SPASM domain-containing protein [Candidatus Magnetoovum chiemensis]|nr:radical SAM additional 4Fe4S-binding SPASM domain-containing protein [Candidatus Magnetoovum chiemensis]
MISPNSDSKAADTLRTIYGTSVTEQNDPDFRIYREKWNERPVKQYADEFPLHIDMESTSNCNLRCSFCWAHNMRDNGGFLKRELAKKVFQEGKLYGLYAVKFNLRGEPLIHPDIHNLVKDAKENGLLDVFFNTNGLLLSKEKSLQLIEAGLDRLTVSCEGYESEMYKKFRDGADFNLLVSNVKTLQYLKKELGCNKPKVRVQTVALPEIVPALDKYRDFWADIADEVACTDYQDYSNTKTIGKDPWVCPFLFQRMTILWDGTMLPCDRDLEIKHPLGNVEDVPIHKVWTDVSMTEMRNMHINGDAHKIDICSACVFRLNQIQKIRGIK